jgi:hypothetical protein
MSSRSWRLRGKRSGQLSRGRGDARGALVTDLEDDQTECRERRDAHPSHIPAGEPGPADNQGLRLRNFLNLGHRERDDGPAVSAYGQMCKRLLMLVRRQSMLNECAELVCVWMLPELVKFAHGTSGTAGVAEAVLSENVSI